MEGKLINQCLWLSDSDKRRLITILQESMQSNESDDQRFKELLLIAESVAGKGVKTATKERYAVIGRRILAYQLRKEEYTTVKIGKLLNRNHASISCMVAEMENALTFPKAFPEEIQMFNEFQKRLKEQERK